MSYDPYSPTKRQLIAICNRAKKLLWDGEGEYFATGKVKYVCYALNRAASDLYAGRKPDKLASMVRMHIADHVYLEDFLKKKLGKRAVAKATPEQIQAWRFLMLDNMIKLLKEEGTK